MLTVARAETGVFCWTSYLMKRRMKWDAWLLCPWFYLGNPLRIGWVLHTVTCNTHILLRKEHQGPELGRVDQASGHLIYSLTTFCPQLICALPTDAKIIQFTECYASARWTLWDSQHQRGYKKTYRGNWSNGGWGLQDWLADAVLSNICM